MGWIVFIVVVIIFISSLRKKKGAEAATRNQSPTGRAGPPPLSKEEQVRRVRAEIQRKIQERLERDRQAVGRAETPRVPPLLMGGSGNERREVRSAPVPPVLPPPLQSTIDQTLERQRELAERIRELEARRERSQENTVTADSLRWDAAPPKAQMGPRAIRADLRDVQGVRRALILREVLGAPVGLR